MNGGGAVTEGPTRGATTGKLVVLALLAIGLGGVVVVQLWLRRPGGKQVRDAGAAYRQLVEIGGVLQRYYQSHGTFPRSLDDLARETDPVTKTTYLSPEMLANPWGAHLALEPNAQVRATVRSRGPGVDLVLMVEKGDRFLVEEAK